MNDELFRPFRNPIYGNDDELLFRPEKQKDKSPRDYLKEAVKFALKDSINSVYKAIFNYKPVSFELTINPDKDQISSWSYYSPNQIPFSFYRDTFKGYDLNDLDVCRPTPLLPGFCEPNNTKKHLPREVIDNFNQKYINSNQECIDEDNEQI